MVSFSLPLSLQELEDQPQYQHLVADPLQSEESAEAKRESLAPPPPPSAASQHDSSSQQDSVPIQLKLPLTLDFDDIAGVSTINVKTIKKS